MWAKILKFAAKYGKKAVKWVWDHKWQILYWGSEAFDVIRELFG